MLNIVVCLYPNCQRTHEAIAPSTKLKAKNWKLSCIKSFQLWAFIFERLASRNEAQLRRQSTFHLKLETLFCSFYNRTVISTVTTLGGGERVRTDDLLRARQALSQLSYTPNTIDNLILFIEYLAHIYQILIFNLQLSIINSTWWAWMELNHRPHAYQACALTKLSYRPPMISDFGLQIS